MPSKLSATQRGYTGDWARASRAYRKENPLCVRCKEQGRLTPATQVDHIKPWRGDRELFWDISNWQSLCASCHSLKTNHEDRGGEVSRGCDTNGNPPGGWNETINLPAANPRIGVRPFAPRGFPTYRATRPAGAGSNNAPTRYGRDDTAPAAGSASDRRTSSADTFVATNVRTFTK